jgi:hypothetical protein
LGRNGRHDGEYVALCVFFFVAVVFDAFGVVVAPSNRRLANNTDRTDEWGVEWMKPGLLEEEEKRKMRN